MRSYKQITFMQECKLCGKDVRQVGFGTNVYMRESNQERRFITSCNGRVAVCTNCGFRISINKNQINDEVEDEKIEEAITL